MKSLLKRIGVAITCAAVACSALVIPTGAAALKGISFGVGDTAAQTYLVSNGGTFKEDFLFTDGDQKTVWCLPLETTAPVATVVVDVAANYTLDLSADGENWVEWAKAKGGAGVGDMGPGNRCEEVADVTEYIPNGKVYIRLGDQTIENGWGGNIWSIKLKYYKYEKEVIVPLEYKDTDNGNFSFVPGSKLEKQLFLEGIGSGTLSDAGRMRFMDHTATVVYRCPIDGSRQFWLNLVLAANYIVKVSIDNDFYYTLDAAEDGKNRDEYGNENKGMRSYNSLTDIAKALAQGDKLIDENVKYLYVKIGDQTPGSGWGGQLYSFDLHYGTTNGVYNPFIHAGVKNTAIRYKRPQKVMTFKTVTHKELIQSDPIVDDGAWDVPVEDAPADEVVDEPIIEEIPEENPEINWGEEVSSEPEQTPTDVAPEQETGNALVWYIVIGAIALILVGGAVTQFILMEKKRKANTDISE